MDKQVRLEDLFQFVEPDAVELFENNKTQVTYLKGEIIIKQGAFANNVILLNNGLARLYMQPVAQRQVNLRLLKKGDFMAFFTIFGEAVYPYSVVALKETTVCMIEKDALTEILLKNPKFALEITSRIYQRENRYLDIISNLSYKQMRGKLASSLLYFASDQFKDEDIFAYLTRQEIADFASITIESAIKFIKEFENEGALNINAKKIEVVNTKILVEISRVG